MPIRTSQAPRNNAQAPAGIFLQNHGVTYYSRSSAVRHRAASGTLRVSGAAAAWQKNALLAQSPRICTKWPCRMTAAVPGPQPVNGGYGGDGPMRRDWSAEELSEL